MKYNNKWYSIIISVVLIGFLLMLTTWVFSLVLKELKDNRWMWDSIKAFAWAEAAQELALLKIKEKGYGIDNKIEHWVSTGSIYLANDPLDVNNFNNNKDTFISYDLNVLAEIQGWKYIYQANLESKEYSIIPLFYEKDWEMIINVENYELDISPESSDLVWNVIAWEEWIWWDGSNWFNRLNWKWKVINTSHTGDKTSEFIESRVEDFLPKNNAYLILFNSWNSNINFTLKSLQKFSKPKIKILSSAQVWNYRHNLETEFDNTKFLNMLKYAVFSN
jgi:hypothetical protein